MVGLKPHRGILRTAAFLALNHVGENARKDIHEWTGYAFHIRRRLTPKEQAGVGEAVDLRKSGEGYARLRAIRDLLPSQAIALARRELGIPELALP